MANGFDTAVGTFLAEIDGLHTTLPLIMKNTGDLHENSLKNIENLLDKYGTVQQHEVDEDENKEVTRYELPIYFLPEFNLLQEEGIRFSAASSIIPRSFLVAMVSQFDAFIGNILNVIYKTKPEMLNASERNLTFANLVQFKSIEEARDYVLEKEIDAVLRENHADHFEYLEKKLSMELRKGLDIWPAFIELTERRNLFVHTNGVVSSQYIATCRKHKVTLPANIDTTTRLDVSPEYFNSVHQCLYEISVKLSQVIWRKLIPESIELADQYLNLVCYTLLKYERYDLAGRILDFALTLPRYASQRNKLTFIVNRAIAHKWGGAPEKARKSLDETDWSACSDDFQIAVAVLKDNFEEAMSIMRKFNKNGPVGKIEYKDWPVFREFRKSQAFMDAYQEIFGEGLEIVEVSKSDQVTILDSDFLNEGTEEVIE